MSRSPFTRLFTVFQRAPVPPFQGYLPTLDGWRALSIIAVILFHDQPHGSGWLSTNWFQTNGKYGVDVFFALSGLLICSRLMSEEESTGRINLRNFYTRRSLRILPAAFAYLAVVYVIGQWRNLQVFVPEILASVFFVRNYSFTFQHFEHTPAYFTVHFWSLSVEEHFYLLLPPMLVLISRRWRLPALLAVTGLSLLWTTAMVLTGRFTFTHTDVRLASLFVPAILAILLRRASVRRLLGQWLFLWPLAAALVLLTATWEPFPNFNYLFFPFAMPFLVIGTVARPKMLFSRLLELAPLRWLGRLSYSLYLWQQLVFQRPSSPLGILNHWPFAPAIALGCAAASHYLLERPMMRLGHRIAPNVGPNRSTDPLEDRDARPRCLEQRSDRPENPV